MTKKELAKNQEFIIKSGLTGTIIASLAMYLMYKYIPIKFEFLDLSQKLAFTCACHLRTALLLLILILSISITRFRTVAMDTVKGKECKFINITQRVLNNSIEQSLVMVLTTFALTIYLDSKDMIIIPIITGMFFIARIVFWIGYYRDPVQRAPGFAMTLSSYLPFLFYAIYKTFQTYIAPVI